SWQSRRSFSFLIWKLKKATSILQLCGCSTTTSSIMSTDSTLYMETCHNMRIISVILHSGCASVYCCCSISWYRNVTIDYSFKYKVKSKYERLLEVGIQVYIINYFVILMVVPMLAQMNVTSTFNKYSKVRSTSGLTGREVAEEILRENGIYDVSVERGQGFLSDYYDPKNKKLVL